jgi:hypothetical protein
MTVGEWQQERQRLEYDCTKSICIYWSRAFCPGLFIIYRFNNNGTTLRRKTMGTEREEKMEHYEIAIAIIGAVVILTWYI